MSQRSAIEINHDLVNLESDDAREAFCRQVDLYVKSGDRRHLPGSFTFLYARHHADPLPQAIATERLVRAANQALVQLVEEIDQRKQGGEPWQALDALARDLRGALLEVETAVSREREGRERLEDTIRNRGQ